ncbi:HDOD domain-containing protein [Cycloclasticus sp.]|uniref:EAL and HDOD domain-containing protein n=1 Tax=Cycloclasticus sp. TaxID=2024830 RepID=UPI000C0F3603|nr:HDOD domain-containing protein [Cycloclasticus sp.]PHR50699.1 MAG: diguanylate phosphodiesterase [Cycloclasticus sp.]
MRHFSFARQPILNRSLELHAYEFLYRPIKDEKQQAHSLTAEVVASSALDLGLQKAANNHFVFINISYEDLFSPLIEALPSEQVILELLEDIQPDAKLIERAQELSNKGFSFALDDFVYSPDWDPLIELASIIKFDLTVTSIEVNKALIEKLQPCAIQFLAEKIETFDEFNAYKQIGCELFQGYFFSKPELMQGRTVSASTLAITQLLADINQPDISVTELVNTIEKDPNLTHMLLKYLNSASFSFKNPIEQIQQAIVILGIDETKKWVTLISLRSIPSKPLELIKHALVRAKLAEHIALEKTKAHPSSFFLMGLLSTLDALLDMTMKEALKLMPLKSEIIDALVEQKGEMGEVLKIIIKHEQQLNWPIGDNYSNDYLKACQWADDASSSI